MYFITDLSSILYHQMWLKIHTEFVAREKIITTLFFHNVASIATVGNLKLNSKLSAEMIMIISEFRRHLYIFKVNYNNQVLTYLIHLN